MIVRLTPEELEHVKQLVYMDAFHTRNVMVTTDPDYQAFISKVKELMHKLGEEMEGY